MPGIVVGIDGSEAANGALAFALEEAKLRQEPLRIVCAWEIPPIEYAGAAFVPTPDIATSAEALADDVLARAAAALGPDHGVHIETASVHGHPATVLVEQAADATLLVVGARGHGALAELVLGSVSKAVVHHCHVPVAVVPAPA
ncbi:MAG TPA: universal stress protein [Gaiellaceae bacterium]|nr:universal stress protein [Gaiellaceae bacterium]